MKVAVVGCGHGALSEIYDTCAQVEAKHGTKIDLLLCCGDFQSVRNAHDLEHLACPPKYRDMRQFYQYYSGEKVAPILTLFVGGNHEASNYLLELFHGGWVAPNIYYMGWAGVYNYGGLRIGGMSGIYKANHFRLGHFEHPPFDGGTMRSVYHVREYELFRLLQLQQPLDIFLSHDWPRGIAKYGDTKQLLRKKSFLRDEIADNSLGNPMAEKLLHVLQPAYWFSAHLHVKFPAIVRHESEATAATAAATTATPASTKSESEVAAPAAAAAAPTTAAAAPAAPASKMTKFLALGKCLPRHEFLQVVDFPDAVGPKVLSYDAEWLAIVKSTYPLLSLDHASVRLPTSSSSGRFDFRPSEDEMQHVRDLAANTTTGMKVPYNFAVTAPPHAPGQPPHRPQYKGFVQGAQTKQFLSMLDLEDVMSARWCPQQQQQQQQQPSQQSTQADETK